MNCLVFSTALPVGYALSDEELLRIRDGFKTRRDQYLQGYLPVIIEVARSQDYHHDFAEFKAAVSRQAVKFESGVLRYHGLQNSGDFSFYAESTRTPELNGKPLDFAPDYTFDSPFIKETWATGIVYIQKDDRGYTIDVRVP